MEIIKREYKVFDYFELNEDAQRKVIERMYDVNVNYEWWECTHEDAENAGITIEEFDCDYRMEIRGSLIWDAETSIDTIIREHGAGCETRKIAEKYKPLFKNLNEEEDSIDDLENDYKNELLAEYLSILKKEYEYLTSLEAIVETIKCNEYTFLEDGTMFN